MHCGLANAPAPFQRFMSEVFKDIFDVCVVVYLEDILIYFDNPGQHLKYVHEVLQRLHASTQYANVEKCAFSVDTMDCLGFVIGPDGLRMDIPKIQVIRNCPAPEQVRMSNRSWVSQTFHRRFIASYSDIIVPLTRLTRKDARKSGLRNVSLSTPQKGLYFGTPPSRFRPVPSSSGRDRRL